jgi:hypothetical protein
MRLLPSARIPAERARAHVPLHRARAADLLGRAAGRHCQLSSRPRVSVSSSGEMHPLHDGGPPLVCLPRMTQGERPTPVTGRAARRRACCRATSSSHRLPFIGAQGRAGTAARRTWRAGAASTVRAGGQPRRNRALYSTCFQCVARRALPPFNCMLCNDMRSRERAKPRRLYWAYFPSARKSVYGSSLWAWTRGSAVVLPFL